MRLVAAPSLPLRRLTAAPSCLRRLVLPRRPGGGKVEVDRVGFAVSIRGGAATTVMEWPVVELRWWWSDSSRPG
jgi:hypothetical protein